MGNSIENRTLFCLRTVLGKTQTTLSINCQKLVLNMKIHAQYIFFLIGVLDPCN
jgi:hypothetical protein